MDGGEGGILCVVFSISAASKGLPAISLKQRILIWVVELLQLLPDISPIRLLSNSSVQTEILCTRRRGRRHARWLVNRARSYLADTSLKPHKSPMAALQLHNWVSSLICYFEVTHQFDSCR